MVTVAPGAKSFPAANFAGLQCDGVYDVWAMACNALGCSPKRRGEYVTTCAPPSASTAAAAQLSSASSLRSPPPVAG
eukprot:5227646-Prymnesium_polylepis.2